MVVVNVTREQSTLARTALDCGSLIILTKPKEKIYTSSKTQNTSLVVNKYHIREIKESGKFVALFKCDPKSPWRNSSNHRRHNIFHRMVMRPVEFGTKPEAQEEINKMRKFDNKKYC